MVNVKWPNGYHAFYKQVRELGPMILTGTVVAIDPSSAGSSLPGFAIFTNGDLVTSGEIKVSSRKPVYERLQIIHERITKLVDAPPDVFALEQIRGATFSHDFLKWSVGATIAAARTPNVIEVPINVWKKVAEVTPGYMKGNAMDAECIGQSLVLLAQRDAKGRVG